MDAHDEEETMFDLAWEECLIKEREERYVRGRQFSISTLPVFKGLADPSPKNIPAGCFSRLDIFRLFIDVNILATFVSETNDYARDTQKQGWIDIDEGDVMRFCAVIFIFFLYVQRFSRNPSSQYICHCWACDEVDKSRRA